jgi:hypothetical protein
MQCSDVGITDECLGARLQGVETERREQARRTVPTAYAPDAIDVVVRNRTLQIRQSVGVASGKVSVTRERMRADHRLPAHVARIAHCALEIGFVAQWARR